METQKEAEGTTRLVVHRPGQMPRLRKAPEVCATLEVRGVGAFCRSGAADSERLGRTAVSSYMVLTRKITDVGNIIRGDHCYILLQRTDSTAICKGADSEYRFEVRVFGSIHVHRTLLWATFSLMSPCWSENIHFCGGSCPLFQGIQCPRETASSSLSIAKTHPITSYQITSYQITSSTFPLLTGHWSLELRVAGTSRASQLPGRGVVILFLN